MATKKTKTAGKTPMKIDYKGKMVQKTRVASDAKKSKTKKA